LSDDIEQQVVSYVSSPVRPVLVLLVVLQSVGGAAPPPADPRAEFRKRNTQHFTLLETDRAGRIRHLRTDDGELASGDDFTLRGWLQLNADFFGGRAEDNDARSGAGSLAYFVLDQELGNITGAAIVRRERGVLDVSIVRATHSPEAEIKAVVGTRHVQVLQYGDVPQRDCRMGSDAKSCKPRVTKTLRRSVVLAAGEVFADVQLRVSRGAVRLVVCVSADVAAPDGADADAGPALITTSISGLPFAVDAASGARLAVASCVPEL
jgi:hypothetical protein